MWILYIAVVFVVVFFLIYKLKKVKHTVAFKYKTLINNLLQLDKNLRIEHESTASIVLFTTNNRGRSTIYLSENQGLLYVSLESISIANYVEKKEWFFIDKMNQYLIFDEIITSFFNDYSTFVFSSKKVKQITNKNIEETKNIQLEHIFTTTNFPQSSFCLAFNNTRIVIENKKISTKTTFEILFFNCVVCYQKIIETKTHFQWQDYIDFLIQYLDIQNLTKQIENITFYFDDRFDLYSKQLELIKNNTTPDYSLLYFYFFEKPLHTKSKIKHTEYEVLHFNNRVNQMILNLEQNTSQLNLASA